MASGTRIIGLPRRWRRTLLAGAVARVHECIQAVSAAGEPRYPCEAVEHILLEPVKVTYPPIRPLLEKAPHHPCGGFFVSAA
jgi:hypothetical protein